MVPPNPNAPCTIHVWAESSAPASMHCLRYGLEQAPLVFNSRYRMRKPAAKNLRHLTYPPPVQALGCDTPSLFRPMPWLLGSPWLPRRSRTPPRVSVPAGCVRSSSPESEQDRKPMSSQGHICCLRSISSQEREKS